MLFLRSCNIASDFLVLVRRKNIFSISFIKRKQNQLLSSTAAKLRNIPQNTVKPMHRSDTQPIIAKRQNSLHFTT